MRRLSTDLWNSLSLQLSSSIFWFVIFCFLGLPHYQFHFFHIQKKKKKNGWALSVCPFPGNPPNHGSYFIISHLWKNIVLIAYCVLSLKTVVSYILSRILVVSGRRVNIVPITPSCPDVKAQNILEGHHAALPQIKLWFKCTDSPWLQITWENHPSSVVINKHNSMARTQEL